MTKTLTLADIEAPALVPTPEQVAIINAARDDKRSLFVRAYAGTGKTTTLQMIAQALPPGPALALAFNVKIKKHMESIFPSHFTIKTLNGLGHSAWATAIGRRLILDEKKLGNIVTQVLRDAQYEASSDDWAVVRQLASHAMSQGLVPSVFTQKGLLEDTKETWDELATDLFGTPMNGLAEFARAVIIEDIKQGFAGRITFDDQIYLSTMFGGVFPRYPLVLVDEAQDLSPLNHIMLRRSAADRLVVVGDEKQAIYAFRGADTASIEKILALREEWIILPLATTFRCPQTIVERVQSHAPGFVAFEKNAKGHFAYWPETEQEHEAKSWTWEHVQCRVGMMKPGAQVAVLCRNNAPLLSMAFKLLRKQIGITMLGRDIGKGLIVLSKKILPEDTLPTKACADKISEWIASESSRARANNHEEKIESIEDRGEALLAVLEGSNAHNAGALRAALQSLFAREYGTVTLSTGHKAKGLEWDLVLHLDPWRLPSKWAKKAEDRGNSAPMEQEKNLSYVIDTRTKHTLIYANLEDFQ